MNETKLNGKSKDIIQDNISMIKEIFPEIVTEDKIDFDKLKLALGEDIDESSEKYSFTWPGKIQSIKESQKTSYGTLRPCKEESKNWDSTENLYIEGDNLEVLKLLQKSYNNKIKMIYIDPPYNTGKDFIYSDNYKDNLENYLELSGQTVKEGERERERESIGIKLSTNTETTGRYHSNWLNMMYPRLKLARNLLKDDGCILISIDDNENVDLKKLCDDIFGRENFISCLIWKSKTGGANDSKFVAVDHEYILLYAKNIGKFQVNSLPYTDELLKLYNFQDEYFEERGPYRPMLLMQKGLSFSKSLTYPIEAPDGTLLRPDNGGAIWRWSESVLKKRIGEGYVDFVKKGNEWKIYTKQYLKVDYDGNKINRGKLLRSVILDYDGRKGIKDIQKLFDEKVFTNPKSVDLMKLLFFVFSNENDYILDFFSGSATVADAILNINNENKTKRKFILVQIPEVIPSDKNPLNFENICEIGKERIRRAGDKIIEESDNKDLDIGFKVFKLDSSNLEKWDPDYNNLEQTLLTNKENIKEDRTELDLIYEIMLKYGIDLTLPIEKINNIYSIGYGALLICLEDNITKEIAEEIMKIKSDNITRVVFKDSGFKSDADKTNIKETLRINNIDEFITI